MRVLIENMFFLLKVSLRLGIAGILLLLSCKNDITETTQADPIEILQPKVNDEYFPEDMIDIIAKYDMNKVTSIYRLNCTYSLDNAKTWSDSMSGIFRSPDQTRVDPEFDYIAFRWYAKNDNLTDTSIFIKVASYEDLTIFDVVGPIRILH